jgi:hypothetical protein
MRLKSPLLSGMPGRIILFAIFIIRQAYLPDLFALTISPNSHNY